MSELCEEARVILDEWFGAERDPVVWPELMAKRWWSKDPSYDDSLRMRFGALLERAKRGELDAWAELPEEAVALIVLIDQFSRNIHRGTPGAFEADPKALELARKLCARAESRALPEYMQVFAGMPFMHAESREAQREGQAFFRALAERASPAFRERLDGNLDFMNKHAVIVERFGRFPHRNEILGRASTKEELEFLKEPGSSF